MGEFLPRRLTVWWNVSDFFSKGCMWISTRLVSVTGAESTRGMGITEYRGKLWFIDLHVQPD